MAKRRRRRKSTRGFPSAALAGKPARGRGRYCVIVKKGSKASTRCFPSYGAAKARAERAAGKHGGFDSVIFYKRKRTRSKR